MIETTFLCPLCGREILVRPARWHRCHYCGGQVLVPSVVRNSIPPPQCPCSICGELVQLADEDDDAVCNPCYDANLRGGFPVDQPTVAPLADAWPVRLRELSALDCARWPLTRGHSEG